MCFWVFFYVFWGVFVCFWVSAAYAFLELQNMDSARLACHADSSSTFQTKLCNMILHDTIDIQKREDTNRCSSYVELVVPNCEFRQHFRQKQTKFPTGSGSCFNLKHGSPMMMKVFKKKSSDRSSLFIFTSKWDSIHAKYIIYSSAKFLESVICF
jgi:hypothetical protein